MPQPCRTMNALVAKHSVRSCLQCAKPYSAQLVAQCNVARIFHFTYTTYFLVYEKRSIRIRCVLCFKALHVYVWTYECNSAACRPGACSRIPVYVRRVCVASMRLRAWLFVELLCPLRGCVVWEFGLVSLRLHCFLRLLHALYCRSGRCLASVALVWSRIHGLTASPRTTTTIKQQTGVTRKKQQEHGIAMDDTKHGKRKCKNKPSLLVPHSQ